MTLQLVGGEKNIEAIAFNCVENGEQLVGDRIQASYKLQLNRFRGNITVQIMIDHMQDKDLCLEMKSKNNSKQSSECREEYYDNQVAI